MTVRGALERTALRRARPQVLAGEENLDRIVRWAHSGEVPNIASLLKGGELLLTTGMGIGRSPTEQRRFVEGLASCNVSAVVIELGDTMPAIPTAMVAAAADHGLPLISLGREIAFVEVTEAIHSEIVSHQLALLRRGEEIHRRFTQLMLDGEGVGAILATLAELIADPVILEDANHTLLFHASYRTPDADVVAAWEALRNQRSPEIAAVIVPAEHAVAAGRLIALPLDSPLDEFDRVALERAAGVIALALVRSHQNETLALGERGNFLSELADGYDDAREAASRAESLGFKGRGGKLVPVAVVTNPAGALQRLPAVGWRDLRRELSAAAIPALLGTRSHRGDMLLLVGVRDAGQRAAVAERVAESVRSMVRRHLGTAVAPVVAVAAACDWATVGGHLRDAARTAIAARAVPPRPWHDATAPDVERVLWSIRSDDELTRFVSGLLEPLVRHDADHRNALLPTLDAYCAVGGHKAEAARALHLGRQALYHRLARIESLLGVDLSEPDTLFALQLALRARPYAAPDG